MYIDLPENTNFKGFFIISKDESEEELLPSLFAYTENEYIKLNLRVSVILTIPYVSTEIN